MSGRGYNPLLTNLWILIKIANAHYFWPMNSTIRNLSYRNAGTPAHRHEYKVIRHHTVWRSKKKRKYSKCPTTGYWVNYSTSKQRKTTANKKNETDLYELWWKVQIWTGHSDCTRRGRDYRRLTFPSGHFPTTCKQWVPPTSIFIEEKDISITTTTPKKVFSNHDLK